jgi:predicted nucleic acid-binding protein
MKVLVDLNILLDFYQKRQPYFDDAAIVMDMVIRGVIEGVLASHEITTLFYFLQRGAGDNTAREIILWVLQNFDVAPANHSLLIKATQMPLSDFEDAVLVASAEYTGCSYIITRNNKDFEGALLPALTPGAFLHILESS